MYSWSTNIFIIFIIFNLSLGLYDQSKTLQSLNHHHLWLYFFLFYLKILAYQWTSSFCLDWLVQQVLEIKNFNPYHVGVKGLEKKTTLMNEFGIIIYISLSISGLCVRNKTYGVRYKVTINITTNRSKNNIKLLMISLSTWDKRIRTHIMHIKFINRTLLGPNRIIIFFIYRNHWCGRCLGPRTHSFHHNIFMGIIG